MTEARDSADGRIEATLKSMIEVDLARERVLAAAEANLPGAWFTNAFSSESGNGTPFPNGISKTGSTEIEAGDPAEQIRLVEGLAELDEAASSAFTERLLRLQQVKATTATQVTEKGH